LKDKVRAVLRKLAYGLPVLRVYADSRRLRLVSEGQERAIEYFKARNAELVDEVGEFAARIDALTAEVRELRTLDKPLHVFWPVRPEDILAAAERHPARPKRTDTHAPPYTLNWVMTPVGQASGGHVDVFRTIAHLEASGHVCRVYFYDPLETVAFADIKAAMTDYPAIAAQLFYNEASMEPCDAIFATSWLTAYPVRRFGGTARKFYYVQDFEPYFEPAGSYASLATNTYRFGFYGLTLGSWLAEKLVAEFDMTCESFALGVDAKDYGLRNPEARGKILFYAKPASPRRGFELGVLTLERFNKRHPEYEIEMVGGDIDRYELSFPCNRNGVLTVDELCELYNQCAAGLVISFTNMSLLPLEMLACGCTPVSNDAPHTRFVTYA
jgi:glycosyltransferase involved in cell wall biosynthesis